MSSTQNNNISAFLKYNRSKLQITQEELAAKAGVGLRFIRDLEQGKLSLRLDKVNQVLALFGFELQPGPARKTDPYDLLLTHMGEKVHLYLKNKTALTGTIEEPIIENKKITGWNFVTSQDFAEYQKSKDTKLLQFIRHSDIENIETI